MESTLDHTEMMGRTLATWLCSSASAATGPSTLPPSCSVQSEKNIHSMRTSHTLITHNQKFIHLEKYFHLKSTTWLPETGENADDKHNTQNAPQHSYDDQLQVKSSLPPGSGLLYSVFWADSVSTGSSDLDHNRNHMIKSLGCLNAYKHSQNNDSNQPVWSYILDERLRLINRSR